jgi:uncharacterized protein YjbI with pentapeptide repeats
MRQILSTYLIAVLVLASCSSGKNAYIAGNYYEAVITSIGRLKRNPDHSKSIETLRQSYPASVTYYDDRANNAIASSAQFRWAVVVESYTAINNMYDEIKRCPGAMAVIPNPVNYFGKLQEARNNAAEEQYSAGLAALMLGTRDKAKVAYGHFKSANDYVPGYKDATKKMEDAMWAATIKVVIEPVPGLPKRGGVSAEFFDNKISEYFHANSVNEFVRFFTPAEIKSRKLTADHIVKIEFDQFEIGQVSMHERQVQLQRDSVEAGSLVSTPPSNGQSDKEKADKAKADKEKADREKLDKDKADKEKADREKLDKEKADKEKADKEKADKEKLDKEKADKEKADKEKADKEKADKEKADKEKLDKEKADKEKADKEKADKEKADKEKADKEKADKEKADKEKLDKEKADKEKADKEKADKEKADKEKADKEKADKEKADKEKLDKEKADKEKADKEKADKEKADKEKADKEKADKEKADKEKADKEKADKEKADKEKADKEKADKEKADKEKADKEKADKEKADKEKLDKEKADKEKADKEKADKENAEKTDKDKTDQEKADQEKLDKEKADKEKADKEKADKEKADKEKADKEKADKEKADKEKAKDGTEKKTEEKKKDGGTSFLFLKDPVYTASASTSRNTIRWYAGTFETLSIDTNKIYSPVKATLYHYKKTTVSKGILSFKIIDAKTNTVLSVEKIPGEYVWVSEWASFNGDERALSFEQRQLCKQKEKQAPPAQEMFSEFTKPIFEQITAKIQTFYRGY